MWYFILLSKTSLLNLFKDQTYFDNSFLNFRILEINKLGSFETIEKGLHNYTFHVYILWIQICINVFLKLTLKFRYGILIINMVISRDYLCITKMDLCFKFQI